MTRRLASWLRVDEIEQSQALYWAAWALLLGWYLEFFKWSGYADFTRNAVESGRQLCWPFFQSCGQYYFLTVEPLGHTQTLAYAILFGLMVGAAVLLARRSFSGMMVIFLVLFAWEALVMGMAMQLAVNYWYFHFLYAALFIFARNKLQCMRVGAVLLYFLSGLLKLNDGWLFGSYFYALKSGLYFVPHALIPVATNAVVFMELVLVWFLLYPSRPVRLVVVGVLAIFHVYSALYVGLVYPTIVLPMILALFLFDEGLRWPNGTWRSYGAGALILLMVCAADAVPYAITGSSRITGEEHKLGVYMFEANYQCTAVATTEYADGRTSVATSSSEYAIERCDPYSDWFYLNQLCAMDPTIARIALTFDTSVNGSPFYRIVDVPNICAVGYHAFAHNEWIKIPGVDQVATEGYPHKNDYRPQ